MPPTSDARLVQSPERHPLHHRVYHRSASLSRHGGNLQSVISKEIKMQLQEQEGRDYPDYLIACVGGGSNAAGTIYEFLDNEKVKIVLAEAGGKGVDSGESAATIHLGTAGVLHGCRTLLMQTDDGQIAELFHLGGIGLSRHRSVHAHLAKTKRAQVLAINDDEALRAAFELARNDGIIPALESAHVGCIGESTIFSG